MENYELQKEEVVLSHAQVVILPNGKESKAKMLTKTECELLLTNLAFVFTTKQKSLLKKETIESEIYDIKTVKWYNEVPHILIKDKVVEIYFANGEKFVQFRNKKEAKEFTNTALRLVSGQSKFVRGVKKAQKEINETGEALNVDIAGAAKAVAGVAGTVAIGAAEMSGASKKAKTLGLIAKAIKGKKNNQKESLPPTQDALSKIKELKELLDSGAITQEEFDKMKKEYI